MLLLILAFSQTARAQVTPIAFEPQGPAMSQPAAETAPAEPPFSPTESVSLKINLPATRLELYVNQSLLKTFRISIGMPQYPTPVRRYSIEYVIWNPWWLPPDSPWAKDAKLKAG
ncbi:MAG: L,D-transpeptidase, partial [Candidatus Promineofilum sp.]|nr:L,D-transpeptidase [Promineifilum sp.]